MKIKKRKDIDEIMSKKFKGDFYEMLYSGKVSADIHDCITFFIEGLKHISEEEAISEKKELPVTNCPLKKVKGCGKFINRKYKYCGSLFNGKIKLCDECLQSTEKEKRNEK